MRKVLFVGDSQLARLEIAYREVSVNLNGFVAAFLCAPGPINNLVSFSGGRISLRRDDAFLAHHPLAEEHDFNDWFRKAEGRLEEIQEKHGLNCDDYDAVIIVSFQFFNPEVWARVALEYVRGHVSSSLFERYFSENFCLNHAGKESSHNKLLKQLREADVATRVISVGTPARSERAEFPGCLLEEGEDIGLSAFRMAENAYRELLRELYRVDFLSYPDELIASNGLCTAKCYQNVEGDHTHINLDGSLIWLKNILQQLGLM